MKKISIFTSTRADYGLLRPIIKSLYILDNIKTELVVSGMHLSTAFGMSYHEIEQDRFDISEKIPILLDGDEPEAISKTMALAIIGCASYFSRSKPDLLLVLGDRYETLAACIAAMNQQIPIAHIHGGETTEGAIDEAIRHSISKMSLLHFTSTEIYRQRVIQLGEDPSRVFFVGATGVENVLSSPLLNKKDLEKDLKITLDSPYCMVTFHPVTLESQPVETQLYELLGALDTFDGMFYIITCSNADAQGRQINTLLKEYIKGRSNMCLFQSLGTVKYLSCVKFSEMVIGNSSSGIIEVPSFGIPTINVGDRQKGRIQARSIINCEPEQGAIIQAMKKALMSDFRESIKTIENPYGNGGTSEKIKQIICNYLKKEKLSLKKKFYDCIFEKR